MVSLFGVPMEFADPKVEFKGSNGGGLSVTNGEPTYSRGDNNEY